MENDEENEKIKKELNDLKENIKKINEASTWDMYKYLFAKAADERAYKKKNSPSLIRKIINKFKTTRDDKDAAVEKSNDKPEKEENIITGAKNDE